MGTKTSVYLTDDLSEAIAASGVSIADLLRRALAIQPRLVEEPESQRTWTTYWWCEAPPKGAGFTILREAWHHMDSSPVREIYAVEVAD